MTNEAMQAYRRKPIAFPQRDNGVENKWFHLNLPPDYDTLSAVGQKLARLNGLMLQGPDPDYFVRAWSLFRAHYLQQLPNGVFYDEFIKSPPFHYQIIRDAAAYQLNAWAAPRGSSKSTILGKELPLLVAVTRPYTKTLMVLAKEQFIQRRWSGFMWQLEQNPYILEDFGEMKPPRGAKIWNHSTLELANGSELVGIPVEGKMLGERPHLVLADDPEHDKAAVQNPNPTALTLAFERLLFGTIMPMLKKGSCLGWIGTLLTARSFLYRVFRSADPRFKYWNRRFLDAMSGPGGLLWAGRWTAEDLERLRNLWGEEMFQTHMMNNPGLSSLSVLKIHPDFCTYRVENEDDVWGTEPLHSKARLVSHRAVKEEGEDAPAAVAVDREYGEVVSSFYRFITVDFAYTTNESSDYSCIHVMGVENSDIYKDTLWSLDMWHGRASSAQVVDKILQMAYKWKVRLIAPEAVGIQQQLVDQIATKAEDFSKVLGWSPRVFPLRYPANVKKEQRIAGLEWRFDKGRIKLPVYRRDKEPYKTLFQQIEDFTEGGTKLMHDDAIDTLAMHQYVIRPRAGGDKLPFGDAPLPAIEQLRQGVLVDEHGISYMSGLTKEEIPWAEMMMNQWDTDKETRDRNPSLVWGMAGAV